LTRIPFAVRVKIPAAGAKFTDWEVRHPQEALGPAAEAASYLLRSLTPGVLTSEFFLDDDRLLGGVSAKPDPIMREASITRIARPVTWLMRA